MTIACTILIPTKDRPNLLARALTSALKAAPHDAEILVVDDGNNPPAQQVIDSFDDPRLKVVVNTDTHGAAGARNFGMLHARGEIVFFIDDDDEIMPHYCNHILTDVLPNAPEVDYGFSSYRLATSDDSDPNTESIADSRLPDGRIAADAPFKRKMCGFGTGFWIRREVFKAVGPIAEDLSVREDVEYCYRLIEANKSAWFSAQPGMRLHFHPPADQSSDLGHLSKRTGSEAHAACVLAVYKRYPRLVQSNRQARYYLVHDYLKLTVKSGRLAPALHFAANMPIFGDRLLACTYALLKVTYYRLKARRRRVR